MRLAAAWGLLLLASCVAPFEGGYWPEWRGPRRDNFCKETGLLKQWPEEGPALVWTVEGIGTGIAGIAVAGGRIFAMGFQGEAEYLTALDERCGERLWATPIGSTKGRIDHPSMRWLLQRAPTVDHDRVYAFSGDGVLSCLDVSDGRVLWRKSHVDDLGGRAVAWGMCDYPLIDGERVVTVVDGDAPSLTALEKRTGQVLWQTPTPPSVNESSWSGQCAATIVTEAGGVRQIVAILRNGAYGFRAEDGKLLWHHEVVDTGQFRFPRTPLVLDDSLILLNGWIGGLIRLNLARSASGVDATVQYADQKMNQLFTQDSAVQVGGFVYSLLNPTRLVCLDAASGKVVWSVRYSWRGN
ncbi:MAG TPA: PQQ-binding-like beta-propeller repeat protein, partial [Planctomycetota bacterium]|nr:PQQ-binding-like beta-propeller repeat protein [Planctomycetota bacterium]